MYNTILNIFETSLPLANPALKFLAILTIILITPIISNRLKIPSILGLIIAGAVIGPNGLNLLLRDSSIILSGTAGLLYILFLAGLDINISDFKKNSFKSFQFGMYTFIIPMFLGILTSYYILQQSIISSVLIASMYASHTLIAYPILSKLGVTKNRAVNITVGGTIITDTLALLVLAIIVGMTKGNVNSAFWLKLTISIIIFVLIVLIIFPIIGRWFFKRYTDKVSQYIFVMVMLFLASVLAEAAGIEAIIGAFLSGLALNKLIPSSSALMNRIEFVGNAIFIPFFLIGVGMLVDYRSFFKDTDTIKVAIVMTIVATLAKFLAALITQKTLKYTINERRIIFGLSNAQAAATLAAVLVGYNVILGYSDSGEPIRLLNESILNGTIVMILITCTIATFAAQKGGKNISLNESATNTIENKIVPEKILIPVSNPETVEDLISLSSILKTTINNGYLYALKILDNTNTTLDSELSSNKILDKAESFATAYDIKLNKLLRYDYNISNAIISVTKEQSISDIILGIHKKHKLSESFIGNITESIIAKCNTTVFIYKPTQPIATIKRHIVIVPPNAENVIGFTRWLLKAGNIQLNTNSKLVFIANEQSSIIIKKLIAKRNINAEFKITDVSRNFLSISSIIKPDDNMIIIMSRINKPSYNKYMNTIPLYLDNQFRNNSFILIYPIQIGVIDNDISDLTNPSLTEPIEKLNAIGKQLCRLFKK